MTLGVKPFDSGASGAWVNIGVHPTPAALVRRFAKVASKQIGALFPVGSTVRVLDACAGDGRLGAAVARRLKAQGLVPEVCFLEVDRSNASKRGPSRTYRSEVQIGSLFDAEFSQHFDVVVSNPPYLALVRQVAERLGLNWEDALGGGRNLYGLAMKRCLDLCRNGGVVAFLGPHGWLRNRSSERLRDYIFARAEDIAVQAFRSRRLFPDVHQDVAIQIFKRGELGNGGRAGCTISYDGSGSEALEFAPNIDGAHECASVRVGAFVWNRETHLISSRCNGYPIVYGGNIRSDGKLCFRAKRYSARQYALKDLVPKGHLVRGPCILVKRSMRGRPGEWSLDLTVQESASFVAVPENHVISVSFKSGAEVKLADVALAIKRFVEKEHRHSGHANVSVALVKGAVSRWLEMNSIPG